MPHRDPGCPRVRRREARAIQTGRAGVGRPRQLSRSWATRNGAANLAFIHQAVAGSRRPYLGQTDARITDPNAALHDIEPDINCLSRLHPPCGTDLKLPAAGGLGTRAPWAMKSADETTCGATAVREFLGPWMRGHLRSSAQSTTARAWRLVPRRSPGHWTALRAS